MYRAREISKSSLSSRESEHGKQIGEIIVPAKLLKKKKNENESFSIFLSRGPDLLK